MTPAISIKGLGKTYAGGFTALKDIDLEIERGEIFALLGPNGAGKTTLIGAICGTVKVTAGHVSVCGHDIAADPASARKAVGLVPQELTIEAFETPWDTVSFSRGLFGRPPDPARIEDILKRLSLWDKKDTQIRRLSGGMKRRVMIAKALAHEPQVLFLDEPSAGVDVELRKSMWEQVRLLRAAGVTIILTTHYLEEAEEIADRIGVIRKGRLILTEDKDTLMKKLGKKELAVELAAAHAGIPPVLANFDLALSPDGLRLILTYEAGRGESVISGLLEKLKAEGIAYADISTRQSSLEEIFIRLVGEDA
ncbi:MAG: ABC transporter ATP-binding protein [Alphaproteobacteria bacterium]|nr:ABC transporter ATP-binding protein [Alphaproteobacteria bacterium]MDE2336907.1 ABC transporter ATP-binding protein [Alphaproteobacteria bacterium]